MTWLDDLKLDTVIVNLLSGVSLKGLVAAVHDDCLILRQAHVLESDDNRVSVLDGEQVILRERIDWIQTIPHAPASDE